MNITNRRVTLSINSSSPLVLTTFTAYSCEGLDLLQHLLTTPEQPCPRVLFFSKMFQNPPNEKKMVSHWGSNALF